LLANVPDVCAPLSAPQCFRLYTRSYFERKMPDTTPPEICRTSLSGAVLQLKALGLPGLDVLSFGFLDPPEQVSKALGPLARLTAAG
jgi:HrpA-like RNA helicase